MLSSYILYVKNCLKNLELPDIYVDYWFVKFILNDLKSSKQTTRI